MTLTTIEQKQKKCSGDGCKIKLSCLRYFFEFTSYFDMVSPMYRNGQCVNHIMINKVSDNKLELQAEYLSETPINEIMKLINEFDQTDDPVDVEIII